MPKLLLDQNLSPRRARNLQTEYPGSAHVSDAELERATDRQVWDYARSHGFVIVSKDSDFNDMSVIRGFPPKVVWLRVGNCATSEIERILRQAVIVLDAFVTDDSARLIELS